MYSIELSKDAVDFLDDLRDKKIQKQLLNAIEALGTNQKPSGCKKLEGVENLWRVRKGDYRIVYQILGTRLVILVVRIGHRKEVYKKLR